MEPKRTDRKKNYTIIIHGKPKHEETRATFSHASANTPSIVVKDMQQTIELAKYITEKTL
jgi:4-hydroxy-3-methylbut-2-enyl diphosphate reductase